MGNYIEMGTITFWVRNKNVERMKDSCGSYLGSTTERTESGCTHTPSFGTHRKKDELTDERKNRKEQKRNTYAVYQLMMAFVYVRTAKTCGYIWSSYFSHRLEKWQQWPSSVIFSFVSGCVVSKPPSFWQNDDAHHRSLLACSLFL